MISDTDIFVYRGDTFAERLVFTNEDGTAVDITGWTIFLTIKEKKADTDVQALISKTYTSLPDPTLGIFTATLTAAETNDFLGRYFYDFQFKTADGKVYTIISGTVSFEADITRRVVA